MLKDEKAPALTDPQNSTVSSGLRHARSPATFDRHPNASALPLSRRKNAEPGTFLGWAGLLGRRSAEISGMLRARRLAKGKGLHNISGGQHNFLMIGSFLVMSERLPYESPNVKRHER